VSRFDRPSSPALILGRKGASEGFEVLGDHTADVGRKPLALVRSLLEYDYRMDENGAPRPETQPQLTVFAGDQALIPPADRTK
jgi:hypothetical protein